MYSTLKECKEYFPLVGLKPHPKRVFNFYKRTRDAEQHNYNITGNIYGMDWIEYVESRLGIQHNQLALSSGVVVKELRGVESDK